MTDRDPATSGSNRKLLGKLALLAVTMFGFGFGMVPLYNAICDATGLRILTKRDDGAESLARNSQVDTNRSVTIEFDASIHGPWRFHPEVRSIRVHPGELAMVEYELSNLTDQKMAGQAIPSYAPGRAAGYFRKLQCFCFEQQTLAGGAALRFPVVFVIDPNLPPDVDRITLSYTYFNVGGMNTQAAGGPAPATVAISEKAAGG